MQLVGALCYRPEGCGFDSQWCHWKSSLSQSFQPHMALGLTQPLTEMSTRNISWGVKVASAQGWQPTCAGSLNLLEPSGPVKRIALRLPLPQEVGSQVNIASIATQQAGHWESSPRGKGLLCSLRRPDQLQCLPTLVFQNSFFRVKQLGCDIDHSPP